MSLKCSIKNTSRLYFSTIVDDTVFTIVVEENSDADSPAICRRYTAEKLEDIFFVTITQDATTTLFSADKTITEIKAAYDEGKVIVATDGFRVMNLSAVYPAGGGEFLFTCIDESNYYAWYLYSDGGEGVSVSFFSVALESKSNKTEDMLSNSGVINNIKYPTTAAVAAYVDDRASKIYSSIQYQIEALAPTVIYSVTNDTLTLNPNQKAILGEVSTLVLSLPSLGISEYATYESEFSFKSGEPATTLTYPASSIIWRGDDCDEFGDFVPESNTNYEVNITAIGMDFVARVGAY